MLRGGETAARRTEALDNASRVFGPDVEHVSEFSATLWVAESGIVRDVTYSAEVELYCDTRSVERVFEVTDVNETTVPRPDWVDRARSNG